MSDIRGLVATGSEARREGRHGEAERVLRQAVSLAISRDQRIDLVHALKALAHVLRDTGRDEIALPFYEEAVALSRKAKDSLLVAHSVRHLGDLHRDAGRTSDSALCYEEAFSLYQDAPDPSPFDVANPLRPAALLREAEGDPEGARRLWTEARRLYDFAGVVEGVQECDSHLR